MVILAGCILFGAWLIFLYPWVAYQFWQSDTFWLIEIGRLILEKHCLPTHDIYSYTSTASPWIVYQWLPEVIFSLANNLGGLIGVAILGAQLLALLCCVLIFRSMIREGTNPIIAVAAIWFGAYAFFPALSSLRPQLFSFLFFWLLAAACAEIKAGLSYKKALIKTFIIGVVWANCHISFLVGLALLAANFAGSLISLVFKKVDKKVPLAFLALCVTFDLATYVTPYGNSLWYFMGGAKNLFYTAEVAPMDWLAEPYRLAVAIITFIAALYLHKKIDLGNALALVGLLIVGSNCSRLFVYFCLFSCPIIGTALQQLLQPWISKGTIFRFSEMLKTIALSHFYVLGISLLSVLVVVCQPLSLRHNVPVQAAKYLADHPLPGNLYCSAHAGSYLMYSSHGAIKVFADTRVDLYDADFVFRHIKAMYSAEAWQEIFAQYKIAAALLPNDIKLKEVLDKQPDWKVAYQDPDFTLFLKKDPQLQGTSK